MPAKLNKTTQEPLRWLFVAEFADGTIIKQTQADKSKTKENGSTFSDVLAKEKDSKLIFFLLENTNSNEKAGVDLVTGAFIINGTPFHAHDQYLDTTDKKLRLIYHRETKVEQQVNARRDSDGNTKQERVGKPIHYVSRYFIGWQTTVGGKNHQATVAVG